MSNRAADNQAERAVQAFMDAYYYPRIRAVTQRVHAREQQLRGIDVILHHNDTVYLVDEKCATRYVNRGLLTFSFELSFLGDSQVVRPGWLVNEDLDTTHYFLMYPTTEDPKDDSLLKGRLAKLECIAVQKSNVLDYLQQQGYCREALREQARAIRLQGTPGKIRVPRRYDFCFYYTDGLAEQPVNIIIKKKVLRRLADRYFTVSKEGVTYLPKGGGLGGIRLQDSVRH